MRNLKHLVFVSTYGILFGIYEGYLIVGKNSTNDNMG